MKQRAFSFNPDCCRSEAYGTLNTADDSTWANRMILHCADILGYCYGDGLHILDSYNALLEYNQAWQELAPSVFSPIFSKEPDRSRGEVFPELWYLDDCTGMPGKYCVTRVVSWHLAYLLDRCCSNCHPAFTSGKDPSRGFRSKSSPVGPGP